MAAASPMRPGVTQSHGRPPAGARGTRRASALATTIASASGTDRATRMSAASSTRRSARSGRGPCQAIFMTSFYSCSYMI